MVFTSAETTHPGCSSKLTENCSLEKFRDTRLPFEAFLEGKAGDELELTTFTLATWRSTTELHPQEKQHSRYLMSFYQRLVNYKSNS